MLNTNQLTALRAYIDADPVLAAVSAKELRHAVA